jgi:hypothetical protein
MLDWASYQSEAKAVNEQTRRWTEAIVGGFISGGSSSIISSTVVATIDPKDWGPHALGHFLILVGLTFAGSGAMSVFKYLKQHPLPGVDLPEGNN